ncbi:hypothetical protein [Streptomyces daliensis]|uniref:Uncharacterized protein n=1 Tax=Streptomyces daliensis TaxID=299421 RepID=A0A8T4IVZ6_9ACTN|nr:hypothetical protein [Streptomyces daliensis]
MSRPQCEVEGDRHVGPVVRYLPTARYPWHEPVWLCPRHGAYLPLAAIRAHVTGETVARAITVFTGAGKHRTDTEPVEPEPGDEPPPALRVVRAP